MRYLEYFIQLTTLFRRAGFDVLKQLVVVLFTKLLNISCLKELLGWSQAELTPILSY